MDNLDYDTKIMTLQNNKAAYKNVPVRPNPIVALEKRVNKLLLYLVEENKQSYS